MLTIRPETYADYGAIHHVNEQAFGQRAEAELIDNLRKKKAITLSLVAETEQQIVGHILFSPVIVESEESSFKAVSLAPIAVLPAYQRKGIGSQLVWAGLEECRLLGHDLVFVVGYPEYYPRFGFVQARPKGFNCEFEVPDEAWMVLELKDKAPPRTGGTVYFQPEFQDAM